MEELIINESLLINPIVNKISDVDIINYYCNINNEIITKLVYIILILFVLELLSWVLLRNKEFDRSLTLVINVCSFGLCSYLFYTQFNLSFDNIILISDFVFYLLVIIILYVKRIDLIKYIKILIEKIKEKEKEKDILK